MTDTGPNYSVPDDFYRAFEDRFRGSQDLIMGRLEAYVPFLRALHAEAERPRGLDLGCGRGEWLRVLKREGFEALGIDLDDGMLQAARERGLNVERKDAVKALIEAPEATFDVVSGFHIFEHLTFPVRLALMREAYRVLRPGGLLILETPNPENVMVGTWSFHLDPTHVAPIPPKVMPFLAEYAGFAKTAILRLNTPPPGEGASLTDVFTQVGFDFALVARRAGPDNPALDALFETQVGLDIFEALTRFDAAAQERWAASETAIARIDAARAELDSHLRANLGQQKAAFESLDTDAPHGIALLGVESAHIRAEIGALQGEIGYLRQRSLFQMLFFRPSGRPVKLLRRLAFHSNGRPRGGVLLGWIARRSDGTPRRLFARWMASAEYAALPWPASQAAHATPASVVTSKTDRQIQSENCDYIISSGFDGGHWITHRNDSVIGRSIRITGQFQEQAIEKALKILEISGHVVSKSCFVDIGANIGTHSIRAAQLGFENIISFEPDPKNFRLLRINCLLNYVEQRVICHQMAISHHDGTMQMELSPSNFGDHRLRISGKERKNLHGEEQWALQDVAVRTFDGLVAEGLLPENGPDLIWIDTQGHEGHVLACAANIKKNRCPVVIEFWPYGLERSGGYQMLKEALLAMDGVKIVDLNKSSEDNVCYLELRDLDHLFAALGEEESEKGSPHTDLLLVPIPKK